MLSHLSYIFQLFNITCFSVLKQIYNTQVQAKMSNKVQYINKENFLEMYFITR